MKVEKPGGGLIMCRVRNRHALPGTCEPRRFRGGFLLARTPKYARHLVSSFPFCRNLKYGLHFPHNNFSKDPISCVKGNLKLGNRWNITTGSNPPQMRLCPKRRCDLDLGRRLSTIHIYVCTLRYKFSFLRIDLSRLELNFFT